MCAIFSCSAEYSRTVTTATLRTLRVEFCAESSGNVNAITLRGAADWTELLLLLCLEVSGKFAEKIRVARAKIVRARFGLPTLTGLTSTDGFVRLFI